MAITYSPNWTNIYDCSVLPQNANPAWTVGATNMLTLSNGQLRIYDNSTTASGSINISNIISPSNVTTLEAKVKIVSASTDNNSVALQIIDGSFGINVALRTNKIDILDCYTGTTVKQSCSVDLSSSFNIIKLVKYGRTKYEVYVNDILVLSGTNFDTDVAVNRIGWGSGSIPGTSDSYWQYIRYCTNGIPKPCKFLIQDKNNILYTYDGTNFIESSSQILDENNFISNGFLDPNILSSNYTQWLRENKCKLLMWTDDMTKTRAGMFYNMRISGRPLDKFNSPLDIRLRKY